MASPAPPTASGPNALFAALLSGGTAEALSLLESRPASELSHIGPSGFTTLHAAVAGGCPEALPALVAAGVPLDAALKAIVDVDWPLEFSSEPMQQIQEVFQQRGGNMYRWGGYTALDNAAGCACSVSESRLPLSPRGCSIAGPCHLRSLPACVPGHLSAGLPAPVPTYYGWLPVSLFARLPAHPPACSNPLQTPSHATMPLQVGR